MTTHALAKGMIMAKSRTTMPTAAAVLLAAAVTGVVRGAEYYVSPSGSDTNPGTLRAPFQTIAKARDVVRTVNRNMAADIIVYLRGGWHVQSATLTFGPDDSGTNGHNVIYQAYPGEHVVISGGRQLTGWTLHDAGKNIWKARAPGLKTRQLYVDCRRAVRAHSGRGLPGVAKTDFGFTTTDADVQKWGNASDIELVFNGYLQYLDGGGTAPWVEQRLGVAKISGTRITMKQPGWANAFLAWDNQGPKWPTDIENAYELLDQPGQWYLDRSQGVVYYIPRPTDNMGQATVIAPVLETLVCGAGVLGSPIHNVQLKGITFAYATWLRPSGDDGFPESQANFVNHGLPKMSFAAMTAGRGFPGGNVVFKTAQAIVFDRCAFTHLGGEGLELSAGSQDCAVRGCVFTDISGNCLRIGNVDDPQRTDPRARDSRNQVTNCYIHDAPSEYRGGVAVFCGFVSDTLIAHNEIENTPYTGVSVGWGWEWIVPKGSYMRNNRIAHNYMHRVMQLLADGAGIYTLGPQPGSVWQGNWFDGNPSADLYPDRGSQHIDMHDNVCSNTTEDQLGHVAYDALPACANYLWEDLNCHDNWFSSHVHPVDNPKTHVVAANNHQISGPPAHWPAAAQDIVRNAGIEQAYRDVKGLRDASSCYFGPADTTPPSAPAAVRNGTSTTADPGFSYYATQLSANWDVSADPESGLYRYWYAIGSTPGATDIVDWTDNGNNLSVTKTDLKLKKGAAYYFSVRAENRAGLLSAPAHSQAQRVATRSLSPGKDAVASSTYSSGQPASLAFDGNYATAWATPYRTTGPEWIHVDLGRVQKVDTVILYWSWHAKAYSIQVSSDAKEWNTVYTTTAGVPPGGKGVGGTDEIHFSPVDARYVRMYATTSGVAFGGYSIAEFEVYGGVPDTTAPVAAKR